MSASTPGENGSRTSSSTRKEVSRRNFVLKWLGSLAVAVPALQVLARTQPASAAQISLIPEADPCANYYIKYLGHYCSNTGTNNCDSGSDGSCVGEYNKYAASTGQYCGSFTEVECEECCHNP